MSNELNLALRIKTDLEAGRKDVEALAKSVERVGEAATSTSAGTSGMGNSVTQLINDMRAFEEANNGALRSMEDIAEQEERLDRLMMQGAITTKEYEEALANLDKAEASLVKEHQQHERALQNVMRTADRTAVEMEKLDSAADELERAFRDGRITVEQYNRAMEGIARRRVELQAMSGTMGRLGLQTRQARNQMITLGRSLQSGSFDRVAFDLLRLSQNADRSGQAFMRFVLPVAAVTASVAAFTAVSVAAWREQRELSNTLMLTGNAAGLTEHEFAQLSRRIEQTTTATIAQSRELARGFAATGRMSSRVIEEFGRTAAIMQQLTRQSTDEIVADFSRMQDGVAEWVAKHNESMNFVTAEQYNYIRVLEEQGDTEAAMLAASEALQERYADQVTERIQGMENWWVRARKAASDYWQITKDITSFDSSAHLVLERNQMLLRARIQSVERAGRNPDDDPIVRQYRERIAHLEAQLREEEDEAERKAEEAREHHKAIAAQNRIRQLSIRADRERQMQAELDKLERDFAAATAVGTDDPDFSAENRQRLEDEIRKRFAEDDDQSSAAAENYVRSLERQADAAGKTAAEIRLLASLEQELSDEQRMRVNGALIMLQFEEERQQQMRDAQQLAGLEVQLLRAQGREAEAAALEMEQQYGELLERLESRSDDTGKELVENLINLGELSRQLSAAEQEIERTMSDLARREQSIDVQRQAGLISEYEARRQILELHRETARVLEQQRPLLEELAQQPGHVGESARAALQAMDAELQMLHSTVTLLEETLRGGLERGLATAIEGLAKGTMTLREAIHALATTVTDAVIQMAAQQLAQTITGSLFGGGNDGAELKEGAAAVAGSAAALATAGGTLVTGAAALEAAAASLMAANAGQSAAGASGSGGDSDWSWVTTAISLFAADGGLVTGPGTGTSDEIPAMLSNREFVVRNASVEQPGAESFLHDFNRRGMAALEDWAPVYHSTGGLAGEPAPAMPSVGAGTLSDPAADKPATAQNNTVRFINVVDPELLRDWQESAEGEQVFVNMLRKNSSMIKQFSGGG